MLNIIKNDQDLVGVQFTGKMEDQDYEVLTPILEEKIKVYKQIHFYWEMKDFEGWKPEALWADLKFDLKHANAFKRIAVVGDKKWEKTMSDFMKPFTNAEIRYFDLSHRDQAWAWVKTHAMA